MFTELSWSEFILSILNGPQRNIRYVSRVENSGAFMVAITELANEKGGKVIIGFDKNNYQLHGVRFEKNWLKAVIEKELTPSLSFDIKLVIHNRKVLYVVDVPEGVNKPYQFSLQQSIPEIKPLLPSQDEAARESKPLNPSPPAEAITGNIELFTLSVLNETLSEREKRCLEFLNENSFITNTQYRDLNGVSHKTAHNELAHLVKTAILKQEGQGRTTKYCLNSGKKTDNDLTESFLKEETKEEEIGEDSKEESKKDYLDESVIEDSLFGGDIGEVIGKINPSVSITDIRKALQSPHMNSHFNENNDIKFEPPEIERPEEQAIDKELAEDFAKEEKINDETPFFEQLDDGDNLLKQLAELYEQIKS